MTEKRTVYKHQVLDEYGLTEEMIEDLLPKPIETWDEDSDDLLAWEIEDVQAATENAKRQIKNELSIASVDRLAIENLIKILELAHIDSSDQEKTVDFIFSNLCTYNEKLFNTESKGQLKSWLDQYHNTLLRKIIKAYPAYTNECARRMRNLA